jgi:hypothetical protein
MHREKIKSERDNKKSEVQKKKKRGESSAMIAAKMEAKTQDLIHLFSPIAKGCLKVRTYSLCIFVFGFKIQEELLGVPVE